MSDHEKKDQADFEIAAPVIEEVEVQAEILEVDPEHDLSVKVDAQGEDVVVGPYGGGVAQDPVRGLDDDLADFSDIDDGIEDASVFSASSFARNKPKKASSSMTAVVLVLLAVGGAGGYFYYTNPDLVGRIKGNLSGESAPSELLSDVNGMTGIDTSASAQLPQEDAAAQVPSVMDQSDLAGMPPQPEPVSGGDVLAESAPVEANAPEPIEVASDKVPDAIPVVDAPAEADIAASEEMIVIGDAGLVQGPEASTPEAVVSLGSGQAEGSVVDAEGVSAGMVPETTPIDAPSVEPTVKAAVVGEGAVQNPDPAKLAPAVEPKEEQESVAAGKKPVSSGSLQEQNDEMDSGNKKEDVFYDAPPGKIMAGLPAPSMNINRGKNESIIVVNSAKKSHAVSSKSTGKTMTGKMTIETTSLDDKVVAASRALKLGRYDAARDMYEELYKLNPRDTRVLMGRAVLYQKLGETARAIATYEDLLAVAPDNAEAVVNLAGLIRKDRPAVALGKLLDLRQKYPNNAAVAAQLGVAYADSGNLQDAFRYLDRAAQMEPENPQHYFNMAIVSERARDIAGAVSFYEKALEVDAIQGGQSLPRDVIYDRLTRLRGQ